MLSGSGRPALSNEQEESTCGFRFAQEASMSGESASDAAHRHLRTPFTSLWGRCPELGTWTGCSLCLKSVSLCNGKKKLRVPDVLPDKPLFTNLLTNSGNHSNLQGHSGDCDLSIFADCCCWPRNFPIVTENEKVQFRE